MKSSIFRSTIFLNDFKVKIWNTIFLIEMDGIFFTWSNIRFQTKYWEYLLCTYRLIIFRETSWKDSFSITYILYILFLYYVLWFIQINEKIKISELSLLMIILSFCTNSLTLIKLCQLHYQMINQTLNALKKKTPHTCWEYIYISVHIMTSLQGIASRACHSIDTRDNMSPRASGHIGGSCYMDPQSLCATTMLKLFVKNVVSSRLVTYKACKKYRCVSKMQS